MTVYHTILQQLTQANNPCNRLKAMLGAKDFVHSNNEQTITFKFKAKSLQGINCLRITLNSMDLYDMEFIKIHRSPSLKQLMAGKTIKEPTVVKEVNGVYADQLKEIFEDTTGLYLSL